MKIRGTFFGAFPYAIASLVLVLAFKAVDFGFGYDSIAYLNAAENLYSGNGFSMDLNIDVSSNNITMGSKAFLKPYTWWPPGYPVSIVLLTAIGVPLREAARLAPALCYASLPFVIFWLFGKIGKSEVAPLVCLSFLVFYPLFHVSANAYSEMLYVLMSLLTTGWLWNSVESCGRRRYISLILCGFFLGMAALTRYMFFFWLCL